MSLWFIEICSVVAQDQAPHLIKKQNLNSLPITAVPKLPESKLPVGTQKVPPMHDLVMMDCACKYLSTLGQYYMDQRLMELEAQLRLIFGKSISSPLEGVSYDLHWLRGLPKDSNPKIYVEKNLRSFIW